MGSGPYGGVPIGVSLWGRAHMGPSHGVTPIGAVPTGSPLYRGSLWDAYRGYPYGVVPIGFFFWGGVEQGGL